MSLGNTLAGFMGGAPCTGVLVRTGVNVTAGATDKMSQFINSLVVLAITLVFMPAFVYIPLPCIAAILIVAATRLIPFKVIKQLWNYDMNELIILLVVTIICVGVDGAIGLMVGGVISLLRTAIKTSKSPAIQARTSDDGEVLILSFTGQVSYINALQAEDLGQELIQSNLKDA